MKILIVDDSENFRALQEKILKSEGYLVESASHGCEALRKAQQSIPDMIVSDISMPVMDGFELCRVIKTDECFKKIPFILYSGIFTKSVNESHAMALGASAFVLKSPDLKELIRTIGRIREEQKKEQLFLPEYSPPQGKKTACAPDENLTNKLAEKVCELEEKKRILEECEEKYNRLVEGLSNEYIFYSYNADKEFAYVSPSIEKILGYSQEEFIDSMSKYFTECPVSRDVSGHARESLKGKKQPPLEVEILRKDGTVCILEINDLPVFDKQGQVRAVEGIARDVTKKKRAEKALRESEEQFRRAFTDSAMGMSLLRPDGRFVEVNQSFCRMLGYSEKEMLSKKLHNICPSDDSLPDVGYLERLLSGEMDRAEFEERYLHKKGHIIWAAVTMSLVRNDKGNPLHVVAQIQDITDRKSAEAEIKKSQRYFESLDRVNKVLSGSKDIHETLRKAAREMLHIFQADRVYLMTPCDPDAPDFSIPVEVHISDMEKVCSHVIKRPMNEKAASLIREILANNGILTHQYPSHVSAAPFGFQARSHIAMMLKLSRGKPWILGMHQCVGEREWSLEEICLFYDIGERMAATLDKLVLLDHLERDISEREKTEEALKVSEQNLKKAQGIAHLGSWDWNLKDGSLMWSDEQFRIFGCEPGEIKPDYDFFLSTLHKEDRERVIREIDNAVQGKAAYKTEFRIRRRDGSERRVLAQGEVFRDEDGKPEKMVGTLLDMTDIKKAEDLILAQRKLAFYLSATGDLEEGLRLCLEGAVEISGMDGGGVYLVDLVSGSLDLKVGKGLPSHIVKSISHYNADSKNARLVLEGKSIYSTCRKLAMLPDDLCCKEGLKAVAILPVVHKKRVIACLNLISRTMETVPDHSRIALETIASQIGSTISRLRIEKALKASEERYALAMEGSNDGLWDRNLETKEVYYSPRWKEIIGYKNDEIPNCMEAWASRVHPEDYDRIMKEITNHFEGKTPFYEVEYRIRHKDGSYRWVLARGASVRDEKGNPTRFAGSHTDITDKKKMEEELIKTGRLESLGLLAGGIAHDFNNILTGVLTNIELLKDHLKENGLIDNDMSLSLGYAESSAMRAADLARQLLTFSKGGAPLVKPVSMAQLLKETVAFVLTGSNVRRRTFIERKLWNAHIDEGQISQVINNLLINAKQAMPEGGEVTIVAENECVTRDSGLPLTEGKYIKVGIRDRGVGISEENLDKVFDPYFTTKGKGNGLGLAISYMIIKRHEGYIKVESEESVGTTFTFYLPAWEGKVRAKKRKTAVKKDKAGGRILLLEDEEIIANSFKMSLLKTDFHLTHVANGTKAIRSYKSALKKGEPYDLVVADLTIAGGMGGVETLENLKAIDPHVRAIVCSGYSDDAVMSNYKNYGFCDSLQKPFSKKQLLDKLHRNMKKRAR